MRIAVLIVDDNAPSDGGLEKAGDLLGDSLNNPMYVFQEISPEHFDHDLWHLMAEFEQAEAELAEDIERFNDSLEC